MEENHEHLEREFLDDCCESDSSESDIDEHFVSNKENTIDLLENSNFVKPKEDEGGEPKLGMVFASEAEAYNFYNNYAGDKGFSVRRHQYWRLVDGSIRKRSFVCSKQGKHSRPQRLVTRTDCPAMIMLTIEDKQWLVSRFVPQHNHDLLGQNQRNMLRSQCNVNQALNQINMLRSQCSIDQAQGALIETIDDNQKVVAEDGEALINLRMGQLMHKATEIATKASVSDKITKRAQEMLDHVLITIENYLKDLEEVDAVVEKYIDTDVEGNICDKDPHLASSSQGPFPNSERAKLMGLKDATLKIRLEKRSKKRKFQVEHTTVDESATKKPPQDSNILAGTNSKGHSHVNVLPKQPMSSHEGLHFGSKGSTASSMPLGVPSMPMRTPSEGYIVSSMPSGMPYMLMCPLTEGCATSSMPMGIPFIPIHPVSKVSFPGLMGYQSSQDNWTQGSQPAQTSNKESAEQTPDQQNSK